MYVRWMCFECVHPVSFFLLRIRGLSARIVNDLLIILPTSSLVKFWNLGETPVSGIVSGIWSWGNVANSDRKRKRLSLSADNWSICHHYLQIQPFFQPEGALSYCLTMTITKFYFTRAWLELGLIEIHLMNMIHWVQNHEPKTYSVSFPYWVVILMLPDGPYRWVSELVLVFHTCSEWFPLFLLFRRT